VGVAIAWQEVRVLAPGASLTRHHRVLVGDGGWDVTRVAAMV
jgi:hypothetical protein